MSHYETPLISVGSTWDRRNGFKCICGHKQRIYDKLNASTTVWCHECFRSYQVRRELNKPIYIAWFGRWKCAFGRHHVTAPLIKVDDDVLTCVAHVESYVRSLKKKREEYLEKIKNIDNRIAAGLTHII